ncbi:MAG TPA: trypsin-like peptidase domain-containing protein [Actinomycetes bacterium]|nr:trypsin-like peptidase domain-containing protein [Actinomycetes bacterium]
MANPPNDPNGAAPWPGSDPDTRPLHPGTAAPPPPQGAGPAVWGDEPATTRLPRWDEVQAGQRGAPTTPVWGVATASDDPPAWAVGSPSSGGDGPGWGTRPPGSGEAPRRRRGGRVLLMTMAALILVLTGALLTLLVDRRDGGVAASAGAGIPTAAPAGAATATVPAEEEPVAAVARILGPSVVQIETGQGLGSGVIYDKNGFILTAAHVVEGVSTVTIRFQDGSAVRGQVLGSDGGNDVAVVKVNRTGLKPATLALKVNLQVGQTAVAIGSPFGLQQTVTSGVVSAKNRSLRTQDGGALEVIQTDAPINPGNSGGALADRAGRVIGINDSIRSESGGNEGVGFAIPIDTAANSAARIVKGEKIQSGYLGVGLSAPALGKAGALIGQVEPGSPAEKAGIEVGDLVTEINGRPIQSSDDLAAQVRLGSPGQEVRVKLVRDGKEQQVTATLAVRPGP